MMCHGFIVNNPLIMMVHSTLQVVNDGTNWLALPNRWLVVQIRSGNQSMLPNAGCWFVIRIQHSAELWNIDEDIGY